VSFVPMSSASVLTAVVRSAKPLASCTKSAEEPIFSVTGLGVDTLNELVVFSLNLLEEICKLGNINLDLQYLCKL
jgi:hypothetical protein